MGCNKDSKVNQPHICYCKYCGKECKNLNSLKQHEIRCKENPNHINIIKTNGNTKHHVSWNKGLTKETDNRVKHQGEKYSQRVKEGIIKPWSSGLTKETDERVRNIAKKSSESISNKVKLDTWHNSFGKSKLVEYNGILFHGNWEVEFAKFLDKHIISWVRPTEKFNYAFENKHRFYTPDFYLTDLDIYIEVKGYPTEKDYAKWNQFPDNLTLDIYFGDELLYYNIITEAKNVYSNVPEKFRNKHLNLFEIFK